MTPEWNVSLLPDLQRDMEDGGNMCSMINKNSQTEIGVQPEGQKSKTASHWLLPLPQFKMVILPPRILE